MPCKLSILSGIQSTRNYFLFQLFSHNDIYFFNRSRKYSLLNFTLNKIDSVLFVHVKYLINYK